MTKPHAKSIALTIIAVALFAAAALTFFLTRPAAENGDYCANPPIPVICEDDMPCSAILDALEEGSCEVAPPGGDPRS